jgi:hypothetical protein
VLLSLVQVQIYSRYISVNGTISLLANKTQYVPILRPLRKLGETYIIKTEKALDNWCRCSYSWINREGRVYICRLLDAILTMDVYPWCTHFNHSLDTTSYLAI